MIKGIGIDIVEVGQIRRSLERFGDRFARRVFTDAEREYCGSKADPAIHFAGNFAAKEAAIKALGMLPGGSFRNIEALRDAAGRPELKISHADADMSGIAAHLSITNERSMAAAVVVLERR